jgi:hypothetical protein
MDRMFYDISLAAFVEKTEGKSGKIALIIWYHLNTISRVFSLHLTNPVDTLCSGRMNTTEIFAFV